MHLNIEDSGGCALNSATAAAIKALVPEPSAAYVLMSWPGWSDQPAFATLRRLSLADPPKILDRIGGAAAKYWQVAADAVRWLDAENISHGFLWFSGPTEDVDTSDDTRTIRLIHTLVVFPNAADAALFCLFHADFKDAETLFSRSETTGFDQRLFWLTE